LTPQLDTAIIEESSVKAQSLWGNPWRIQGQIFAITKWDLWWHRILQCPNYLS